MLNTKIIRNYCKYTNNYTLLPWCKTVDYKSLKIVSANNSKLYTSYDKKKYIYDFTSGLMVVNLGHNNKYILDGITEHINSGIGYLNSNFETEEREKLSERIINNTNKNGKVFYTNAGADANETAIFIAKDYHFKKNNPNHKVLSLKKSFHGGSTIISSLISGDNRKKLKYSLFNNIHNLLAAIKNPSMDDNGEESLNDFKKYFQLNDVACILIEGSSGSAGCIQYPKNYLSKLSKLCKEYDVIMICDEVMSGWYRTGTLFAYQQDNFTPDIITTAKGITSGYTQLGAVIVSKKISDMYNKKPLLTGLTYFAHPLSCKIANKCFDLYINDSNNFAIEVPNKSKQIKLYESQLSKLTVVKDFRIHGLLGCIELTITDENTLKTLDNLLLYTYNVYCYRRNNFLFIAPPLTINYSEIDECMDLIYTCLERINKCYF